MTAGCASKCHPHAQPHVPRCSFGAPAASAHAYNTPITPFPQAGMNDYLSKPVSRKSLQSALRRVVKKAASSGTMDPGESGLAWPGARLAPTPELAVAADTVQS